MSDRFAHNLRFLLRYPLAALMIPIGVFLGVCGLVENIVRNVRNRRR